MALQRPEQVTVIQDVLNKLGYDVGTADGMWGNNTSTGFARFLIDVQKEAAAMGAYDGEIDALYGDRTKAAIEQNLERLLPGLSEEERQAFLASVDELHRDGTLSQVYSKSVYDAQLADQSWENHIQAAPEAAPEAAVPEPEAAPEVTPEGTVPEPEVTPEVTPEAAVPEPEIPPVPDTDTVEPPAGAEGAAPPPDIRAVVGDLSPDLQAHLRELAVATAQSAEGGAFLSLRNVDGAAMSASFERMDAVQSLADTGDTLGTIGQALDSMNRAKLHVEQSYKQAFEKSDPLLRAAQRAFPGIETAADAARKLMEDPDALNELRDATNRDGYARSDLQQFLHPVARAHNQITQADSLLRQELEISGVAPAAVRTATMPALAGSFGPAGQPLQPDTGRDVTATTSLSPD